jgi:hypothetical protein
MRILQEEAGRQGAHAGAIRDAHRAARRGSRGWWLRLAARAEARHPRLAQTARARADELPERPGDLDGA